MIIKKVFSCLFCGRALAYEEEGRLVVTTRNSQQMLIESGHWTGFCKCGMIITVSGMLIHFNFKKP